MDTNNNSPNNEKIFVYEVLFSATSPRRARSYIRVPFSRMSTEVRRILKAGGKIIKVISLEEYEKDPWWVEISTRKPKCTYYFGPFNSEEEALTYQPGYVEDLTNEGSQDISVNIKKCDPPILTIFTEDNLVS